MSFQSPEEWYGSLPRITKVYLTTLFFLTLMTAFNLLDANYMGLNWQLVRKKFEIWRLFTNFLYVGPFSLKWIFFVSVFSQFCSSLERNSIFDSSPGAYLYFVIFQMLSLSLLSIPFFRAHGFPFLAHSLLSAIIYYWSRRDMWSQVSVYFFTVKAYQLPFAILIANLLMGSSIWIDVMGIISGHVYYVLRETLPEKGYPFLLRTPAILDSIALKLDLLLSRFPQFPTRPNVRSTQPTWRSTQQTSNVDGGPYQRPTYHSTGNFIGRGVRLGGDRKSVV